MVRRATSADVGKIASIAASIHTSLPERPEVLEEKMALFGAGCLVFADDSDVVGYGLSHPWVLDDAPALDSFIQRLPHRPNCLFIHDVAILPGARGAGLTGAYVSKVVGMAVGIGLDVLALVSVYGTGRVWERHGFKIRAVSSLAPKLAGYGSDAVYMTKVIA